MEELDECRLACRQVRTSQVDIFQQTCNNAFAVTDSAMDKLILDKQGVMMDFTEYLVDQIGIHAQDEIAIQQAIQEDSSLILLTAQEEHHKARTQLATEFAALTQERESILAFRQDTQKLLQAATDDYQLTL